MTVVRIGFGAGIAIGVSSVILNNVPVPFAWIAFLWFGTLATACWFGARPFSPAVWFNLAFPFIALGIAELCVPAKLAERTRTEFSENVYVADELLGYTALPNVRTRVRRYLDDRLVYDAVYTTDADGSRVAPPRPEGACREALVTFGGSFTFGEGVDDEQTWPYLSAQSSGERTCLYNFALGGYGPHQMLAMLEHGIVERRVLHRPRHAVYLAIANHVDRAVGASDWDRHGPYYRLLDDGSVRLDGRFDDERWPPEKLARKLKKSRVAIHLGLLGARPKERTLERKVATFVAIVDRARSLFEETFPGGAFHVVYWDIGEGGYGDLLLRELGSRRIRATRLGELLPDAAQDPSPYLIVDDGHPNARFHQRFAEVLGERVLR